MAAGGALAAAPASAAAAPAEGANVVEFMRRETVHSTEVKKEEPKKVESSDSEDDLGLGLFD